MAKPGFAFYIGEVEGLDAVYAALEEFRPKLQSELVVKMKSEAEAIAKDIDRRLPNAAPMSGFNHGGGSSWANKGSASAKPAGKALGAAGQEWPIYSVAMGGWASAMCDIAGAGSRGVTPQAVNMVAVLNSRNGRASRWVWPTANAHVGRIEKNMKQASGKVEEELSRRLAARAGG